MKQVFDIIPGKPFDRVQFQVIGFAFSFGCRFGSIAQYAADLPIQ